METKIVLPEGVKEFTLLEGTAQEPAPRPVKINISGDIYAPKRFIINHLEKGDLQQQVSPAYSVVQIYKDKIQVLLNPTDPETGQISGCLAYDPNYEKFAINRPRRFSREEIVKLFRFNKRFFFEQTEWANILADITSIKASANVNVQQTGASNTANKISNYEKTISHGWPKQFRLFMPIYKGLNEVTFSVELVLDIDDNGLTFWMESVSAQEIEQEVEESIKKEYIKLCDDLGLTYFVM